MKTPFYVTARAGKEVAGFRSPGAGEMILLTEEQAAHPLRLKHITREAPVKAAMPKKSGSVK